MNKKAFIPISALMGALVLALFAAMTPFVADPDRAYAQTATIEFAENGMGTVATFAAEDPEGATPVAWLLPAAPTTLPMGFTNDDFTDATHFDIDAKTGVLTFDIGGDSDTPDASVAPDFEAPRGAAATAASTNTYTVVVGACDVALAADGTCPGNTGYHKATVKVTDVNEPGKLEVAVGTAGNKLQFRNTSVLTGTLTDGDVAGPTKGITAGLIVRWYRGGTLIESDTDNNLEYTVGPADVGHTIRVVATYIVGSNVNQETASWTSAYPVIADRVGDNMLKFDPDTIAVSVAEGEKGMMVGAPVRATGNHGAVVYSLAAGVSDNDKFDIDERSGQITFKQDLNREVVGSDTNNCGANFMCVVRVTATDATTATLATATATQFADATVNITLTDVNEKPEFITDTTATPGAASPTSIKSPENAKELWAADRAVADGFVNAAVGVTYLATDPENRSVTYHLMGPDMGKFELSNARVLSFRANPDYEMPGDADGDNMYEVTVRASDGTLTADQMVMVMVTNLDEGPAVSGPSSANFAENGMGTVATFAAEDPEGATPVAWLLPAAPTTLPMGFTNDDFTDATHFDIDAKTGVLTFDIGGDSDTPDASVAPDFEAPRGAAATAASTNTYTVVVGACDVALAADGTCPGNTGYHKATVKVTDVNEPGKLEVAVGTAGNKLQFRNTSVLTGTLTDGDVAGPTKGITAGLIVRWYRGGTLIESDTDNNLEYTVGPADVGHTIRVVATYIVGSNVNQETASWTSAYPVIADRVGDNMLKFDPDTIAVSVAEGEKGMMVGAPVRATGNHGAVVYSLAAGVSDNDKFDIDERSGQITFKQDLNREVVGSDTNNCGANFMCVVRVTATDATTATLATATATQFADATVNITLTDVNEKPEFITDTTATPGAASPTSIKSPENAKELWAADRAVADGFVNAAVGVTYLATDPENRSVTYHLMGPDMGKFELSNARVLSFRANPDYEMPGDADGDNMYEVTVRASDGTLTADQMVIVMVTDLDESPVIMGGAAASDPILDKHDTDNSGTIELDEAVAAVQAYARGEISLAEAVRVVQLYATSG